MAVTVRLEDVRLRRADAEGDDLLAAVGEHDFAPEADPDYDPLLPDGEYEVAYEREQRVSLYNRKVWVVEFRVVGDGVGHGERLRLFLSIPRNADRPRPSWALVQVYGVATGLRPPRDLARRRPSTYLAGCVFRARVRAGRKDSKGVERPEGARYSKVEALVEHIGGTPPCRRKSP